MLRRFRRWRRTLPAPAFFALDLLLMPVAVVALLPFVGWPDALWGVVSALPIVLVMSGFEWMERKDPMP